MCTKIIHHTLNIEKGSGPTTLALVLFKMRQIRIFVTVQVEKGFGFGLLFACRYVCMRQKFWERSNIPLHVHFTGLLLIHAPSSEKASYIWVSLRVLAFH